MENKNWWNSEVEEEWKQDSLHQVMQALSRADKALKPPVKDMFTDVYDKLPSRLQKQHQECMNHVAKYPHEYPTELYENWVTVKLTSALHLQLLQQSKTLTDSTSCCV